MLTDAERMLAQVSSAPDAVAVMKMAEVARTMAERMRLGTSAINHATSIKMRAERRLADAVDAGQENGEIARQGKPPESGGLATLSDLGVSYQRLNEARLIRDEFTDDEIEQQKRAADEKGKEVRRDRLLRMARDKKSQSERDKKAARTVEAMALPPSVDVRHGDFREVFADLHDIDAIITDPPYPRDYLGLFADLAEFADRVLAPDGVLAVMSGQTYLPEVYAALEGGRPYRWTMAYLTPGAGYASHARRVQSNWKPVLVYGGGPRFGDVITSDGAAKHLHEWGQDLTAFTDLIERLTEPESLVCDPFLGGGTTALAAVSRGRRFVGCDNDSAAVAAAVDRLAVPA